MRSTMVGFWLSVFLVAGSATAFCQVIVQPNGSGHSVPLDTQVGQFQETVTTSGAFDYMLTVLRNSQVKFYSSGSVCTSGPTVNVSVDVPLSTFGLMFGDSLTFVFTVQHRSLDMTRSTVISVIPVVSSTSSSTTIRPISRLDRRPALPLGRREEHA